MVSVSCSYDYGSGAIGNMEDRVGTIKMTMLESLLRALNWILPPVPFFAVFLLNRVYELTWWKVIGAFSLIAIVSLWLWIWLIVAILNKGEGMGGPNE